MKHKLFKLLFCFVTMLSWPARTYCDVRNMTLPAAGTILCKTLQFSSVPFIGSLAYAIIHDNIAARICPDYFVTSKDHKRIIKNESCQWLKKAMQATDSPTKLGFAWGWQNIGLGALAAGPAAMAVELKMIWHLLQHNKIPQIDYAKYITTNIAAYACIGVTSALVGLLGYFKSKKVQQYSQNLNETISCLTHYTTKSRVKKWLEKGTRTLASDDSVNRWIGIDCAEQTAALAHVAISAGLLGLALANRFSS